MYQVPKSKKSIKQNQFEFEIDGKQYTVPLLKYLPVSTIIRFESEGFKAVLEAFGTHADIVGALDQEQFEGLTKAWTEESGIDLGESQASDPS